MEISKAFPSGRDGLRKGKAKRSAKESQEIKRKRQNKTTTIKVEKNVIIISKVSLKRGSKEILHNNNCNLHIKNVRPRCNSQKTV